MLARCSRRASWRLPLTSISARHASSAASSTSSSTSRLGNGAKSLAMLTAGSIAAYYLTDTRCSLHAAIGMPLLRWAVPDAEDSHRLAVRLLQLGVAPRERVEDAPCLEVDFFGLRLSNPVGIAAGFDKNAECVDGLFDLGFGMVEIGSVTPKPQPGNPRPRMFRLVDDLAVINRYGFNSDGAAIVRGRLKAWRAAHRERPGKLLGVNLGKNKTSPGDSNADYVQGIGELGPLADYLVVNISSPNTPGLRALQKKAVLEGLVREAVQARNALAVDTSEGSNQRVPPLLVKIAPDLDEQELKDIAEIVMENGVDGVIISNTTVSRPESLKSGGRRVDEIGFRFSSSIHSFAATLAAEAGGLSGRPLKPLSLTMVARFYKLTGGRMPIVGCGGITTGADAVDFIEAGASFVQVYSGFAYQGPGLVRDIKDELEKACRKRGVSNVRELVGRRAVDLAKS